MERNSSSLLSVWLYLSISALFIVSVDAGMRVKRQTTFRVISEGQAFPCESATMQQYTEMGMERIELNDDQKLDLLHQLGGEYQSSFMGVSGKRNKFARERGLNNSPWRIGKKVGNTGLAPKEPMADDAEDLLRSTPTTTYEYCSNRTDPDLNNPQYLLMCTSCAKTTKYGKDTWPTELYETDCMNSGSSQDDCLYHQGSAHGRCQQSQIWLSVLKKSPTTCIVALADGSSVITEEWYLDNIHINVGCQCTVNKNSEFR